MIKVIICLYSFSHNLGKKFVKSDLSTENDTHYLCYFDNYYKFNGEDIVFNNEKILNKIDKLDVNNKGLCYYFIIDDQYACVMFPNLKEIPNHQYFIDNRFITDYGGDCVISVKEYIIKNILE